MLARRRGGVEIGTIPKRKLSTIRARLLVSFVIVTLLPTIGISVGSAIVGYRSGHQQAVGRLESAAALQELALSGWAQSLQQELVIASHTEQGRVRKLGGLLLISSVAHHTAAQGTTCACLFPPAPRSRCSLT
jgi:hypothetical protein